MLNLLFLAAFLGAPGLILGAAAGWRLERAGRSLPLAILTGFGIGLCCGAGVAVQIVRDVESSRSSTAVLGLILVPLGFITNCTTGTLSALVANGLSGRRSQAGRRE